MAEHASGFGLHHDHGLIWNRAEPSKLQTVCLILLRNRTHVVLLAA